MSLPFLNLVVRRKHRVKLRGNRDRGARQRGGIDLPAELGEKILHVRFGADIVVPIIHIANCRGAPQ